MDFDFSIFTFAFRRKIVGFAKQKKRITRSIFNALKMGLSQSFSRSTVRFNFGFYRSTQKVKTKIKRYLGRALPNTSLFENALNIE
jgi:hypothetical protein